MMRILIGFDGSDFAEAIFDDLERAGLPRDVEAIVLTSVDVYVPPAELMYGITATREVEALLAAARATAERGAAKLRTRFPQWEVTAEAATDSPAWALVKRAEGIESPWRADLIVVATAGRSALGRFAFGSVAHSILIHARTSVRICRRAATEIEHAPPHILLGVDDSLGSEEMVSRVVARSWPQGTQFSVASAVEELLIPLEGAPSAFPPLYDVENAVAEATRLLVAAGLDASSIILRGPARPQHALLRRAEAFKADCIFVGAHGRGRIGRLLMGSTSSAVAMHAPCSVEVVRQPVPSARTRCIVELDPIERDEEPVAI